MQEVLEVKNIEKYYGNKGNLTKAIDNISFNIAKGEFVGIMGASGSGKSTLLNCISTIDRVTSGNIKVNGEEITKLKGNKLNKFRREELGFIFQDFNLLDTLSCYENIALALTIQKVPAKEIQKRVNDVAEKLGITEILKKYPYQVSGGQKQRVAIARALMRHPAILLADEPVASLDPVTGRQILGLLKSIHETDGVTILMNSHNLEFSQEFSDRLIGLKDGKVVFDGKTADLTDSITTQIYNKNDTQIENKRGVAYE